MSLARTLWAVLKDKSPRTARLLKVYAITPTRSATLRLRTFNAMTLATNHVTHHIEAKTRRLESAAYGFGRAVMARRPAQHAKHRHPHEATEASVSASPFHGIADVLALRYLDRHYKKIWQALVRNADGVSRASTDVAGNSIMLIGGSLGPGGAERQTAITLTGLASRGFRNLALVCVHLDGDVNSFFRPLLDGDAVSVSVLGRELPQRGGDSTKGSASACGVLNALADGVPDELNDIPLYAMEILSRKPGIVHAWLDEMNVKAGLAAAILGVPRIVLSTRSVAPAYFHFFKPYMREGYRTLLAHPNVVLLNNSAAGARDYEMWLGLPKGTVKIIRNGFDFSALSRAQNIAAAREFKARLGIPAGTLVVGSVLRFSDEKQPFLWIDVAQRIRAWRNDVMFIVVGDGPLQAEMSRYAEARDVAAWIRMPGYEPDVAAAITAMDVFLLTSRVEGFPNVLVEAQALGVPVVTTDVGGAVETLDDGITGLAVAGHSPELLARAVLRILGDDGWRETAREAAQRFVRERFSADRMVEQTLDVYFGRGEFRQRSDTQHDQTGTVETMLR